MSQQKKKSRLPLLRQPKFKVQSLLADIEFYEGMGKELKSMVDRGMFTNETTISEAKEILAFYRKEYKRLIQEAEKL